MQVMEVLPQAGSCQYVEAGMSVRLVKKPPKFEVRAKKDGIALVKRTKSKTIQMVLTPKEMEQLRRELT